MTEYKSSIVCDFDFKTLTKIKKLKKIKKNNPKKPVSTIISK